MNDKRIKITRNTIDQLKPDRRDKFLWDAEVRGLGVKVSSTGTKRWVFQYYDNKYDRDRRMTLGDATCLMPHDARKHASQLYAQVRAGICPASAKAAGRSVVTMSDLFDRFMNEHSRINNKPSTVKANEGRIQSNLQPYFGKYRVDEVSSAHIDAFRATMGTKHVTFNRCLALLHTAFKLAKRWKLRIDNPCEGIGKYKETEGTRVLSDDELNKIVDGLKKKNDELLDAGRTTSAVDALRLLACQGFRVREITTCEWSAIKWDRAEMELPDSKTGRRIIPLGPVTMAVLKEIDSRRKATGVISDFVCPSPADCKRPISYTAVKDVLADVSRDASVANVTTHTFRRTSATSAAASTPDMLGLRDAYGWSSMAMPNRYVKRAQVNARRVVDAQTQYLPAGLLFSDASTQQSSSGG